MTIHNDVAAATSRKAAAMDALIAFANEVFKGCDGMRKAELIDSFAAALKAASPVDDDSAILTSHPSPASPDFRVDISVSHPVAAAPVTSFSVVRLHDGSPELGRRVLTVGLEEELTQPEQRALADLLLSVARRTRLGFARPAS